MSVKPGVTWGYGKVIGAKAYGNGTVDIKSKIMGIPFLNGLHCRVDKVNLTGELGIMGYIGFMEYKKPFYYNTWKLYERKEEDDSDPIAGGGSGGGGGGVYSASVDYQNSIYNAQNYETVSLEYLSQESAWNSFDSSVSGESVYTDLISLLENTYHNAQPVVVSDGEVLYAAFLSADAETEEVYVVTTKLVDGVWSEPVRVDDAAI